MSWITAAFTGFVGGAVQGVTQTHREPAEGSGPTRDYYDAANDAKQVYANTPKAPTDACGMGFEHPIHIHIEPPAPPKPDCPPGLENCG